MQKKLILLSASAILILSLLFMCTPQVNDPDDTDNNNSSASSSSASSGSSSSVSSAGSSSVGDSTNFTDAILISTDGTHYLASLTTADQDYYKFNGVSGTKYIIETFSEIDDTDTTIYLFNSAQAQIAEDQDGGNSWQSRIIFNCASTETYYVMVEGFDEYTSGDYAISVKPFIIEETAYLKSIIITPDSLTAPGTATIKAEINRPAGVTINSSNIFLYSPNEYQNTNGQIFMVILSYKGSSGLWEAQFDFNIYNESGTWIIKSVNYVTSMGNYDYEYFSSASTTYYIDFSYHQLNNIPIADIDVTTSSPDTGKPELISIIADPISIDSTGTINFSVNAADSLSGISGIILGIYNYVIDGGYWMNLSYNSTSGKWEGSKSFNQLEPGEWFVNFINLTDVAGNTRQYQYADIMSTDYYCYFGIGINLIVTTIPLVSITKTGSVSQSIVKSLQDKSSKVLPDKNLRIRQNIKKSRNK